MIRNDEHWLAVADLFGSAALDGGWPAALRALADASGAEQGQIIGVGADKAVPFNWITGLPAEGLAEFVAIEGGDPARNPRVARGIRAPVLEAWHEVRCSTDEELRRNFTYADFCRRYDIPHGSQTNLLRDETMLIGLAVLRSQRRGVPQGEDRRAFEAIAPQARAAVRMQLALEGRGAELIAGALESLSIAAFVCDGLGQVRALTREAEAVLARGVLRLSSRRLRAPGEEGALEDAISAASAGGPRAGAPLVRTLVVRAPAGGAFEVLDVLALPRRDYALGFQPCALVVVRGGREAHRLGDVLRAAFGLTPAEADIAVRLADGDSREAVAEARGASIETVRSQVKSLFSKLDVSRTGELAARLNRLR